MAFLYWLGDFHPASTELTVGSLLLALLSEMLLLLTGHKQFAFSTRYLVWIAGIAAPVTAMLGWCFAGVYFYGNWVLMTHRILGSTTATWALATLIVSEISRAKESPRWVWAFRAMLLIAALLVAATGYFGGSMIYGVGHYSWS